MGVICPKCGREAKEQQTKYGLRSRCCDLWSWDGKPLVSRETHAARQMAHKAFDALWKSKRMSRKEAYRRLAYELAMPREETHISQFDIRNCLRTKDAVKRIEETENERTA